MKLDLYLFTHKIKPTKFAAQIGVNPSTITRILNGERVPSLDVIIAIEDGTGGEVTAKDFLDERREAKAAGVAPEVSA